MAKRKMTDNTMAKRRRTDNTMAKRRRTDNTMAKRRRTKEQIRVITKLPNPNNLPKGRSKLISI
jgi:hypothetical protein